MGTASDDLEEFFDFAQLEQDHVLCSAYTDSHHGAASHDEGVTCMDWQPVVSNYSLISQEQFDLHRVQEWPLDGVLDQSLTNTNLTSADHNAMAAEWPINQTLITHGHHHLRGLPPAPLSSSLVFDCSIPTGPPHNHDSTRPLTQTSAAILIPPISSTDNSFNTPDVQAKTRTKVTHPVSPRVPLPTRRPSSASWKPASAKRKGPQSRIPLESRHILEDEFATNPYPCSWEYDIIAHQANLDVKKVRNWFNNTRARKKGEGKPRKPSHPCLVCSLIQTSMLPCRKILTLLQTPSIQDFQGPAWRLSINKRKKPSKHLNRLWHSTLRSLIKKKASNLMTCRRLWTVIHSAPATPIEVCGQPQGEAQRRTPSSPQKEPPPPLTLSPLMVVGAMFPRLVVRGDVVEDEWLGRSLRTHAQSTESIALASLSKTCPSFARSVRVPSRPSTNGFAMKILSTPCARPGSAAIPKPPPCNLVPSAVRCIRMMPIWLHTSISNAGPSLKRKGHSTAAITSYSIYIMSTSQTLSIRRYALAVRPA
jgi:hypothetical protein